MRVTQDECKGLSFAIALLAFILAVSAGGFGTGLIVGVICYFVAYFVIAMNFA